MEKNICIRLSADIKKINEGKRLLQENKKSIEGLTQVLGLTANEVRFKILYLLNAEDELCVCDLSDILEMKIPAVSQHLRKLKDGGILGLRKEGPTYFYYIKKLQLPVLETCFELIGNKGELNKKESLV